VDFEYSALYAGYPLDGPKVQSLPATGTVAREIRAQMQELGAGVFMGLFQFGSVPHALATKNIEPFAKTVLPALRRE
jgi:hypothetical protein